MQHTGRTGFQPTLTARWPAAQSVCLFLCMPLTIGLVMLLVWNLYLALQNKTTIEFHEGVTANIKVCFSKRSQHL